MIEEEKESVRREMKEYRRSFTLSEKRRKDEIIFKKVTKNKRVLAGKKIGIYLSKEEEIDTKKIITQLLSMDKKVYIPKVIGDDLIFTHFDGNYSLLMKNRFNILEVDDKFAKDVDIDVLILPALSVDKKGYRLGYGKGFFDRYLLNKKVYSIALVYKGQIVNSLPSLCTDYKVDEYISD
ncbi:MAG: 5-formyltetrahydrofolate cyclo-ligase [Candidatus Enterosoma sp.]|nr:5-formyltetrahydrofolate cyclo-ligase [Candidatus Enterosoma sp.]